MPPPAVLPVQEIWDAIIGNLCDNEGTLRAISLVCRSFVSPAQRNLFYELALEDRNRSSGILPDSLLNKTGATETMLATRLVTLLGSCPHLLPYIQSLRVHSQELECFNLLATIPWQRLEHLRISFDPKEGNASERSGYIQGMAGLVKIPSLLSITVASFGSRSQNQWMVAELRFFLSSCSKNIKQLELYSCCSAAPEAPLALLPASALRPRLHDLTLKHSPSMLNILSDAFDFTQLHTFRYSKSWTPDLDVFLRRYGSTVERLFVTNKSYGTEQPVKDETLNNIDIGLYFPSLKELHVDSLRPSDVSPHSDLHAMISRIPPNNTINTLRFRTALSAGDALSGPRSSTDNIQLPHLTSLEAVILQTMPNLSCVEVQVDFFWPALPIDPSTGMFTIFGERKKPTEAAIVREVFPILWEKNLVSMSRSRNMGNQLGSFFGAFEDGGAPIW
ncbi:hypothetical protein R3P38DRAFT_374299 [Favolaschia claudopus]|uniref:F-box domain-containing protein n=1 Tax=Favolaschia claudopus TaxID=2862362 RepID=A0AAV9ZID8_9AGAR